MALLGKALRLTAFAAGMIFFVVAASQVFGSRFPAAQAFWRLATAPLLPRADCCTVADAWRAAWRLKREQDSGPKYYANLREVNSDPEGREQWSTPVGDFWIPKGNLGSLAYLLLERDRSKIGEVVRLGDIVLDCGANVGIYTREALSKGALLVVAIEPAPENIACLRRTFAREIEDKRVIVYPKGVWDEPGNLDLTVDEHNSEMDTFVLEGELARHGSTVRRVQVPVTTIDLLAAELDLPRVDLIKMDIEGAEQRALKGARSTLARFRPRMAIAGYHLPDDPDRIPVIVKAARPDYLVSPSACILNRGRVMPETLFFR